jgi:hypothetical protein
MWLRSMGLAEARVRPEPEAFSGDESRAAPISRHLLMADVVSQAEALLPPAVTQPTGLGQELSAGRPGRHVLFLQVQR